MISLNKIRFWRLKDAEDSVLALSRVYLCLGLSLNRDDNLGLIVSRHHEPGLGLSHDHKSGSESES
jgi:hypothetical protein